MMVEPSRGVEGDVAVLASRAVDIDEDMCLNFDVFLVLSNSSSENMLRVTLALTESPTIPAMTLHEITTWGDSRWRQLSFPVPKGTYVIQFEYTMGIPYRSVVAIDKVQIKRCQIEVLNRSRANGPEDTGP